MYINAQNLPKLADPNSSETRNHWVAYLNRMSICKAGDATDVYDGSEEYPFDSTHFAFFLQDCLDEYDEAENQADLTKTFKSTYIPTVDEAWK